MVERSERRWKVANIVLLAVGYLLTGPYVVVVALLGSPPHGWAVFFVPAILWLAGLILGVVLYRSHPWAAIRTARYAVIVVALVAVVSLFAPLLLSVPPIRINE